MDVDEAQYDFDKWTGIITMKIEKFSEFAQEGEDASRLSDPIYVRGLPWKILAKRRKCGLLSQTYFSLAYFLQCNAEDKESTWSCHAFAGLKLLAQKEGKEDYVRTIEHTFNAKDNDWGFAQFMSFDSLLDPENGWYDQTTDSIILSIEFNADMPYGIQMKYGMCEDMDMGNLFDQRDQYSDSVLVSSDGIKFKVYKGILACRSPVFAAMFRNNEMIEAQNGIVQIEDIRSEVLEQLLRFMYGKKQPNMEENIAQELLSAADKYELVKLKVFCECKLAIALNHENACELLVLADQHSAKYLQANAIKFIQKNAKKVRQTEGWKMLVKGKYAELLDQIMEAIVAKEN